MKTIKEVTLYAAGDSRDISLWSNVPYFVAETLISKGIKVNRVDLSPAPLPERLYHLFWWRLIKLFHPETTHMYVRSLPHFRDVRRRIRKAIRDYPDSVANIFLTFSFSSAGLTDKLSVQFCDWTYDHFFSYFENRKPDPFECRSILREDSQIEGSDLIFPLFSSVVGEMKRRYKNPNIFYLGNVINAVYEPDWQRVMEIKSRSNSLLFIGDTKYKEGAMHLIHAFGPLRKKYPALELDIVGMKNSDFDILPEGVVCHGYLDKGKEDERARFYALLERARLFVNTTPKWGAISATLEAMYYYTPVIVSPYLEFVETFGKAIDFGAYCEDPEALGALIEQNLGPERYENKCARARDAVKHFTWDAFIDRMLEMMEEKL